MVSDIRRAAALAILLGLCAGAADEAAARTVCSCHRVHRVHHRRYAAVRAYPGPRYDVIPAAVAARRNAWEPRDVMGRMITPPTPGITMDNDGTADYLGKGGTAAAVLHLPSLRGDIQR